MFVVFDVLQVKSLYLLLYLAVDVPMSLSMYVCKYACTHVYMYSRTSQ
jgi:hypothetical protein